MLVEVAVCMDRVGKWIDKTKVRPRRAVGKVYYSGFNTMHNNPTGIIPSQPLLFFAGLLRC